jgi:membrane-associated phospholipid phosphatase
MAGMVSVGSVRRSALWRELGTALRRVALPAAAIAAGVILLGLLIVHVLASGWLAGESGVNRELARDRTPALNTATHVFTYLAETPTIVALTAVAAVVFRLVFRRWRESVYVVLAVAGETLIFLLTTVLIDRKRPAVPPLDDAPPTSSYPSGHTAAAVCFYGSVALIVLWHYRHTLLRAAVLAPAILVPLLVGASRLYRGMHFLSDVVAGLLLGSAWLSVTTRQVLARRPGGTGVPAHARTAGTPTETVDEHGDRRSGEHRDTWRRAVR